MVEVGVGVAAGITAGVGNGSARTAGNDDIKGWPELRCGLAPAMSSDVWGLHTGACCGGQRPTVVRCGSTCRISDSTGVCVSGQDLCCALEAVIAQAQDSCQREHRAAHDRAAVFTETQPRHLACETPKLPAVIQTGLTWCERRAQLKAIDPSIRRSRSAGMPLTNAPHASVFRRSSARFCGRSVAVTRAPSRARTAPAAQRQVAAVTTTFRGITTERTLSGIIK
jgi:hypothetical protein